MPPLSLHTFPSMYVHTPSISLLTHVLYVSVLDIGGQPEFPLIHLPSLPSLPLSLHLVIVEHSLMSNRVSVLVRFPYKIAYIQVSVLEERIREVSSFLW